MDVSSTSTFPGITAIRFSSECSKPPNDIFEPRSLIENARSYTTNAKYSEWQPGIISSLPHLEEALQKLQGLEIPTAEKDLIEAVRIAVNTPFMQARSPHSSLHPPRCRRPH